MSRMYNNTSTWSPFKGCHFDCRYCVPSFQLQAKRQKHRCTLCYQFRPHCHPERLDRIPAGNTIFVGANGDISFCPIEFTKEIITRIRQHNQRCPYKTYYFQSKRPEYFRSLLEDFPENVILLTTLETNRDDGYEQISQAPPPSRRFEQFLNLDYPRKMVTVEPVMEFDEDVFPEWLIRLRPECVWLGYNSRPRQVQLPEPTHEKLQKLVDIPPFPHIWI